MIVDTFPVFYYEKMVGYMSSSFADLAFTGERIEVGLRRGKFDYIASASTNNRRSGTGGSKKKEGDTHVVTLAPTWPITQQTPQHPTYQYSPHQPNYSANIGNPPNPAPVQQRLHINHKGLSHKICNDPPRRCGIHTLISVHNY